MSWPQCFSIFFQDVKRVNSNICTSQLLFVFNITFFFFRFNVYYL